MTKHINLQKNYTSIGGHYQLKLPINIDCMIPVDDSVHLLSQFVEGMDLEDLYLAYSRLRENQAPPRQMLKIVLYFYMNHRYSSRAMETSCRRDIYLRIHPNRTIQPLQDLEACILLRVRKGLWLK
ncbi:hypothetical protein UT300016_23350 [Clostridium senegalense]